MASLLPCGSSCSVYVRATIKTGHAELGPVGFGVLRAGAARGVRPRILKISGARNPRLQVRRRQHVLPCCEPTGRLARKSAMRYSHTGPATALLPRRKPVSPPRSDLYFQRGIGADPFRLTRLESFGLPFHADRIGRDSRHSTPISFKAIEPGHKYEVTDLSTHDRPVTQPAKPPPMAERKQEVLQLRE